MPKARKRAKSISSKSDSEKLEEVIRLLNILVAIELFNSGVPQQEIAKKLGIAKANLGKLLKGVSRET